MGSLSRPGSSEGKGWANGLLCPRQPWACACPKVSTQSLMPAEWTPQMATVSERRLQTPSPRALFDPPMCSVFSLKCLTLFFILNEWPTFKTREMPQENSQLFLIIAWDGRMAQLDGSIG